MRTIPHESTYQQVRDARMADPSIPFWFKRAAEELEQKDILDVMLGLDDLRRLFERRYYETTRREWSR